MDFCGSYREVTTTLAHAERSAGDSGDWPHVCEGFCTHRRDRVEQLRGKSAERLFDKLTNANADVGHPTSKNYLYVIRMAVYYADGGRDGDKLRWNAWTDAKVATPKKKAASKAAGKTGKARVKKA